MKNTKKVLRGILLPLFLLTLIFSCSTREDELSNDNYVGTWNWVSTDGGIVNTHQTPASTGIVRTLTFARENAYKIIENDVVVNEGTYNIVRDISSLDHVEKTFINFSNYADLMVQSVDSENLFLTEDANDGFSYHYSK